MRISNPLKIIGQTNITHALFNHSKWDEAFTNKLLSSLQKRGIRVWQAPYDFQRAKRRGKIIDHIKVEMQATDKHLLILSEKSINPE
jgi:hypothetical protein